MPRNAWGIAQGSRDGSRVLAGAGRRRGAYVLALLAVAALGFLPRVTRRFFDTSVRVLSFTAARRVEYDLIVPPELLKEAPCQIDGLRDV